MVESAAPRLGPLEGLRVLDISSFIAAPAAAVVLGELRGTLTADTTIELGPTAVVHGAGPRPGACTVSIAESSQFASALLLAAIGVYGLMASASGFASLLVAHHLAGDGDTMEMMRAVLDSNFWLATHVPIINLGYAATYLAGALAILYIARGALTSSLDAELGKKLERSVYAITCFAALFSFTGTVLGGMPYPKQRRLLEMPLDVLVATPGRLIDFIDQGKVDFSRLELLVLDEADRMLDMGFIHDVKKVLALLPAEKQSLLFSATFSDEIRDLANNLLRNPQSIQVTPRNTTVQRITQVIHPVGRGKKKALLAHIIQQHNWSQVLVFTRTKFGANNVAEYLTKNGINAMALHGNKSQTARTQALAGFKSGEIRALVATDIAAQIGIVLRNQYVLGYVPANQIKDGKWKLQN